ncbi:MAG: M56 family metallopeptidase [Candidatus Shapirobacteria bacterium]|jgi:hypothetical protein
MSDKRLNFKADVYLGLIITLGLAYLIILGTVLVKVFPGLAMQIMFAIDAIKFRSSLFLLISQNSFWINLLPGMLTVVLAGRWLKASVGLALKILRTNKFINGLKIVKATLRYRKFAAKEALIFTAGFIKPQIYVSSAIFKLNTSDEFRAMLWHEINHQKNFHPLKILICGYIKELLPPLPGKEIMVDSYLMLAEVASDNWSEKKNKSKVPLVSALLKFQHQSPQALASGVSYFNSQSERIKILVGQNKQSFYRPMIYSFLMVLALTYGSLSAQNLNIFYQCPHLGKCLETLAVSKNEPLSRLDGHESHWPYLNN